MEGPKSNQGDVEANEQTALMGSGDAESPGTASEVDEAETPWPATFERSISLLASPVMNEKQVNHFTKSPKPGNTPLTLRGMRVPLTPEGTILAPLARHKSIDARYEKEGVVQDFKATTAALKEHERKAKEASEYRAKLLAKQNVGIDKSPGYRREKRAKSQREKSAKDEVEAKATNAQCIFNLINILMGVGLLGLPFAFASAGYVGGVFAIFAFSFVTWKTSILIGRELNGDPRPAAYFDDSPFKTPLPPGSAPNARMRKPLKSFPAIALESFGRTGSFILSIVLYFELFSCICIFIVAIGDHMHTLFPSISNTIHMAAASLVMLVPMLVLKTARLLSYLSMLGTVATVAVVCTVVIAGLIEGDITEEVAAKKNIDSPPYHPSWKPNGLAMAFGLVAYCFSGHAIVPSIYSSMKNPQDFERVVNYSYVVVLISCLAVGAAGYWMFGTLVYDQVTISLEENSKAGMAMTLLTYLMVLTAFSKSVLTMFPLALGFEEIFAPYLASERAVEIVSVITKVVLLALCLVVSVYIPSFSLLCSLVGMICTMTVSIIFPAAAHLKLFGNKLGIFERMLDWIFVLTGAVMAVVGTILSVG